MGHVGHRSSNASGQNRSLPRMAENTLTDKQSTAHRHSCKAATQVTEGAKHPLLHPI